MTPPERLELDCLRAWRQAGRALTLDQFTRYCRLEDRERMAATLARITARNSQPPKGPTP